MRRLTLPLILLVMLPACPAAAQSASPDTITIADWPTVVAQFAQALVSNDPSTLAPLLAEDISFRWFNGKQTDALHLMASARNGRLISARGYVHAPQTAASDLADRIRDDPELSEDVKANMVPRDDAHLRRANVTAALWLTDALAARGGDPVGILVVWKPEAGSENNPMRRLLFVLVKGRLVDGAPRIAATVFGSP